MTDQRSRFADIDGPLHYLEYGGPTDGPRMVLVHGLGGSHLNWSLCAPELARRGPVWALDLPGFGASEPAGRSATVSANAAVLVRFVREVVGAPAIVVGNSMGGMVGILAVAGAPDIASRLMLVDPSLPLAGPASLDPAVGLPILFAAMAPRVGARSMAARRNWLGSRTTVEQTLRLVGVEPLALPPELLERSVALVESRCDGRGMDQAFVEAARSLVAVNALRSRYWAAMAAIAVPVLLLHGERDRLVTLASARQAANRNPSWRFEVWPGVGHVPQLQVPDRFVRLVLDWLDAGADAAGVA